MANPDPDARETNDVANPMASTFSYVAKLGGVAIVLLLLFRFLPHGCAGWTLDGAPSSARPGEATSRSASASGHRAPAGHHEVAESEVVATGGGSNPVSINRGRAIIEQMFAKHSSLDPFYSRPRVGLLGKTTMSFPEADWGSLSGREMADLWAYLHSLSPNWEIAVGRINGRDILYDRIVVVGRDGRTTVVGK